MRVLCALLVALTLSAQEAPPPPAPAPSNEDFTRAVIFGKKFADLGDYASAYENFAKADAIKPDDPAVLYDMGVVLARAGRYAEAQVKVDRYLKLFPEGAEKANVQKLQYELEFQRELQKKRQADQEYADLFNRAKFLYGRAELDEALKLFRQAEQLRATDPAPVYNEALVFEKQGDYAKAIERYRRYAELESDSAARAPIDERVFNLEQELEDMRTKIVCSHCGRKLPIGATWCERCWHGPYLVKSAVWNTRPCAEGASATRATYFADGRFDRNDILPCLFPGSSLLEALRYTPARQREIQNARKVEGWTYENGMLSAWTDKQGNQIRYVQGPEYLEKVTSTIGGEILTYVAHENGEGIWLLDREDLVIDAQRYTNRYSFDAAGRIAQQQADYQNAAACNHLISMTAGYAYNGEQLSSVNLKGGYEGFAAEGRPKADWSATSIYVYDDKGRVAKEELSVTSFNKAYAERAAGALRDDINSLYAGGMRAGKKLEHVERTGDLCASAGAQALANFIDLRPFYTLSPNLGMTLPNGIGKVVVSFTY